LPVAGIVRESQRLLVQHLQKALRAAEVLDVRLAVRRGGGEIEAVGFSEERCEVLVDLGAPSALLGMSIAFA